jgi:hypothetical protein
MNIYILLIIKIITPVIFIRTAPFFNSGIYGLVTILGRHQYIYDRATLLAKFLNQYMLLTDEEWEQFKANKEKVKQVQWDMMPFLSWGLFPSCF